jgi:titin
LNNGGSAIVSYTVQKSVDGGRTWTSAATVNAPTTSATITGLTNGVAYVFRAYATNGAGIGAASTWITTSPVAPPAAVASVRAVALTGGATLQWTPPADNGGAEVVGYVVQKSVDGGVTWVNATQIGPNLYDASAQTQSLNSIGASFASAGGVVRSTALNDAGLATTTSVNFTGLQEGTSYAFRIKVYTVVGESPWAETRVTTGVTPAPAPAPTPVTPTPTPTPKPAPAPAPVVKPAGVVTIKVAVDAQMVPTSKVMSIAASNLKVGSTATVTLMATIGTKTVQKSLASRTIGAAGTLSLAAKLSATLPAGSYKLVVVGTGANSRTVTSTVQFVIPASWSSVVEKLPEVTPTTTTAPKSSTTTVPKSNSGSTKSTTTTTLPTTVTTTKDNGSISPATTVASTQTTVADETSTSVVAVTSTTLPQDVVEVSISTGPRISTGDIVAVLGIGLLVLLLLLAGWWFIAARKRDDEEEEDVNV